MRVPTPATIVAAGSTRVDVPAFAAPAGSVLAVRRAGSAQLRSTEP